MRNPQVLLVFLFCGISSLAQQIPQNANSTDSKGRRQGKWTIWFTRQDEVTTSLDSLEYYRIIEYKNDRPVGITHDYYPTGELQSEGKMLADRPEEVWDGTAIQYRKNGAKEMVGVFDNGKMVTVTFYDIKGVETKESLESLTVQGSQLIAEGYYEMALPMLERAYAELQKGDGDDETRAIVLGSLGLCYTRMGNLSKAKPLLLESVGWAGKRYSTTRPGYADALTHLGQYYLATGEFAKAEPLFLKAKQIYSPAVAANPKMWLSQYAGTLNNLAMLYQAQGKFAKAEPLMLEVNQLYSTSPGPKQMSYANSLTNLAVLYYSTADYSKSETLFLQAKGIYEKELGKQSPLYANVVVQLGALYMATGNYSRAESSYLEAKPILAKTLGKDSPGNANLLDMLAQLYVTTGDYEKSEAFYLDALKLRERTLGKDHIDYANTLNNLGELYQLIGKYFQAESLYKEALSIVQKGSGSHDQNFPMTESVILLNLANLYQTTGDYPKSEQLYLDAIGIIEKLYGKEHDRYALSLNNLGVLYEHMGAYPKAEQLFKEALDISARSLGKNHPNYAKSLNNLAYLYQLTHEYTKAEPLYREALAIAETQLGKQHPDYAQYLENLAILYTAMNCFSKAEPLLQEARETHRLVFGASNPTYAISTKNIGTFYIQIGALNKAESLLTEANEVIKNSLGTSHPYYTAVLHDQSLLYDRLGNTAKASTLISNANENYLHQLGNNFPTLSESEKEAFYKTIKGNFDVFNAFCVNHYGSDPSLVGDMFNMQLATKALLLNSSAKWKQRIRSSGDKKLFSLYSDWESKQVLLARMYKEAKVSDRRKLDSLEALTNALEKDLSKRSEMFASIADKKRYTWQDVKVRLKPGEVAIEMIRVQKFGLKKTVTDTSDLRKTRYPIYGLTDTVYYAALLVTAATAFPEMVLLKNGNELENRDIKHYRNAISSQIDDIQSFGQFWDPIARQIKKMSPSGVEPTVYFSPDGVFNLVNLNTLFDPTTKKYLLDEVKINLLTTSKDLLNTKNEETFNNLAYLFGYPDYGATNDERSKLVQQNRDAQPSYYALNIERGANLEELPGTKTEVEHISSLMAAKGWQAEVLVGDMALEETLKDCFKPRVLHIATHGHFQPDSAGINPLVRSGLMLTGAAQTLQGNKDQKTEDGILTAYEAMNLNLDNTDLVVLSACETGLGDIRNGEGVYGLQRAFKVAGAKTIVMSLWKVSDDATQELMVTFYENWLNSNNKRQAFQLAQQKLKETHKSPYYWGAFVMLGE